MEEKVQHILEEFLQKGDYPGLFNTIYENAAGNDQAVPWVNLAPHPHFLEWARKNSLHGENRSALVVGSGLGDDAEELARLGFKVTGFDFSPAAIAWCHQRFPQTEVSYHQADLFALPEEWPTFDFILEIFTLQSLPRPRLAEAIACIAHKVAKNGSLLIICLGSDIVDTSVGIPVPLTHEELNQFLDFGLQETSFEDFIDQGGKRFFRVLYKRS